MKESNESLIVGRNPVGEAIESGREIEQILAIRDGEGSIRKLIGKAKSSGIRIRFVRRKELDRISGGAKHQGIAAFVQPYEYASVSDILKNAERKNEDPFVIILDGIEDPHNLGAIMRTAECAGAHGVIIGKNRSAGLGETAAKSSAGAVEYVPCARVTNTGRTIDELKEKGLWIAACDMDGEVCFDADLSGPIALVIGSEGKGISRLVREKCDFTVSIPLLGHINSLNASNAAAVLMYEVRRQRDAKV